MRIDKHVEKILVTHNKIIKSINKCADWINSKFKNQSVVLIGVLKGCTPFVGHLLPKLKIDLVLDFISVSSYANGVKQDENIKIKNLMVDVKDKNVIIADDVIDSGRTLKALKDMFISYGAKSVTLVTLVDKKEGRKIDFDVDYSCLSLPNEWIVGWGFDIKESFRNLPYIGILKKEYQQ
ncbi:hypoxanthine phosphoribosyltransferase [Malacoplasma iowae]|uniref:hypoxanthine phosphoribosyltransferase n=1 Tax=Malacoplasma iowae TaxID=2116 RepID=UPI002A18E4E7|nr:hypoxanthine phosphoribosyltransferase [Malacoplasma iowae]WPL39011.1 hypoxanthine phosphoribosyltransferase [Malacoplasma iowae]WPL39961.1 hypoxanthine phosphoribosyltransferase [Malacoplasma iowae]